MHPEYLYVERKRGKERKETKEREEKSEWMKVEKEETFEQNWLVSFLKVLNL